MSARAAWRLETLGFEQVYRYQPGKDGWLCAGLPLEGRSGGVKRAFHVARRDVPTCSPHEQVGDVARRVADEDWPLAVVLNEERVILGRLRPGDLRKRPDALVEEIMVEGPRTVRGSRPVEQIAAWLDERKVPGVLITTADGELIGYVRRDEVEPAELANPS
jgi:CBS domain-containing protein